MLKIGDERGENVSIPFLIYSFVKLTCFLQAHLRNVIVKAKVLCFEDDDDE